MQPEMTPHEIANEIRARQVHCRIYGEGETFVMVEGKTDEVLWEEYRSRDDCTLYPAYGKDKIIDALDVARRRDMRGVAGIVDADYWLITEADVLGTENLLYDGCCPDMESLLLCSPALKKVLRNNLYNYDVNEVHAFAEKLAAAARRIAAEFGYFRLLNHLKDLWLRCNSICFEDVIDCDNFMLDRQLVASKLAGGKAGLNAEDLLEQIEELKQVYAADNPKLCRGKDMVAIAAHLLPKLFQQEFGDGTSIETLPSTRAKTLSKDLRIAYEFGYFLQTSLYSCIRSWESANAPYKILKPDI